MEQISINKGPMKIMKSISVLIRCNEIGQKFKMVTKVMIAKNIEEHHKNPKKTQIKYINK